MAVTVAYALAAWFGLWLATLHGNVSPLWPPSGVALAAVVAFGPRAWPGVAGGAFCANILTGIGLVPTAGITIGNTVEALVAGWLVRRLAALSLGGLAGPVAFLGAAAVASATSAAGGVATLIASGEASAALAGRLFATWWSGDALGTLLIAPLLLYGAEAVRGGFAVGRRELARLAVLGAVAGAAAIAPQWLPDSGGLAFAALPVILLAAHWFGRFGAMATAAGFVVLRVVAAATRAGADVNESLLQLEIFLAAVTFAALLLAHLRPTMSALLPTSTLLGGWVASALAFEAMQRSASCIDELRLHKLAERSSVAIASRMTTYSDALRAGASLYAASCSVERAEWIAFAESLDMVHRYPGILGIGVIDPVRAAELPAYVAEVAADDCPEFAVRAVPGVPRPTFAAGEPEHFVIRYIEPADRNRQAIGLDVGSEANRRRAAQQARDTGTTRMTDKIVLVQDGQQRPGFLLYVPMFARGAPLRDVAARRRAHQGWIYAPFVTESFLSGVLGHAEREVDLSFYRRDERGDPELLFATAPSGARRDRHDLTTEVALAGRTFTIGWDRTDSFVRQSNAVAMLVAAVMALVAVLLAGFVINLQTVSRRAQRLAATRTRQLVEVNAELAQQVADRRRAEAAAVEARAVAEDASRKKSDFLATMSHEIRTPLNSVIGFTGLLMRSSLSPEQQRWATYIETSGRSLLTLINDILDFSKIEAGKLLIEAIPFAPEIVVREVVGTMTARADDLGIGLTLEEVSRPPRAVIGDPNRFLQVLLNLVSNALKFTAEGGVVVRIAYTPIDAATGTLYVAVSDSGIGIAPDRLGALFQDFTQADASISRRYGGTGLGLAISKRLVELMGGRIWATSTIGVGSTFHVELSCTLADGPVAAGRRDACDDAGPVGPRRVLLVEDVAMNQALACAILRRQGCDVRVANNGREAVAIAAREAFDVIFMDCQMPEMDGLEATRRIREGETARGAARVPIVALTANALDGDRERCFTAGMDDYVSKPIRPEDLERSLRRWGASSQ